MSEKTMLTETKRSQIRETLITRFQKVNEMALNNIKRDTWKIAHTALNVVNSKNFADVFSTKREFAEAVGYSAGAFTKLVTVAEIDSIFSLSIESGLTTGQVQELIPLYRINDGSHENLVEFLNNYSGNLNSMTTKHIRSAVKDFMKEKLLLVEKPDEPEKSDSSENSDCADTISNGTNSDETIRSASSILEDIAHIVINGRAEFDDCEDNKAREIVCAEICNSIYKLLDKEGLI